jgi:hypothetical protein
MLAGEMWILEVIHEYLVQQEQMNLLKCTGTDNLNSNRTDSFATVIESLIVVLHKHTGGNATVTRYFVSDLWLISDAPLAQLEIIQQTLNKLQPDLRLVSSHLSLLPHKQLAEMHEIKHDRQRSILHSHHSPHQTLQDASVMYLMTGQLEEMLKAVYNERSRHGIGPLCSRIRSGLLNGVGIYPVDSGSQPGFTFVGNAIDRIDTIVSKKIKKMVNGLSKVGHQGGSHILWDIMQRNKKEGQKRKASNAHTKKVPCSKKKSTSIKYGKSSFVKKFFKSASCTKTLEKILSKMLL